jgi:hypothetical protein
MLVVKTNPVGIDKVISKYQKELHDYLIAKWSLLDADLRAYPRIYKNQRGELVVPEVFTGGKEYKEINFDDASYLFFAESDRVDYKQGLNTANVYAVFRLNLTKLKPAVAHRADEEVRIDVQQFAQKGHYAFELQSIETGVSAAFREYSGWVKDVKYSDMHPWHVFRLNFLVKYDNRIC